MSPRWLWIGLLVGGCTTANAASRLTVQWTDNNKGLAVTRVERKGEGYVRVGEAPAGVNQYVDTSVVPNVLYCYRVQAAIGVKESGYSIEACAVAPIPTPKSLRVDLQPDGTYRAEVTSDVDAQSTAVTHWQLLSILSALGLHWVGEPPGGVRQ